MSIKSKIKKHRAAKANGTYQTPAIMPQTGGRDGRGLRLIMADRTHSLLIDQNAAPFEYMSSSGLLRSKQDPVNFDQTRFSAGVRLRSLMTGAEPVHLKTLNFENESGGTKMGFSPTESMIDCMNHLRRVRSVLDQHENRTIWREPRLYSLLDRLIYRDDWTVINQPPEQRKTVVAQIHYGLDCLSEAWGYITFREFSQRWG